MRIITIFAPSNAFKPKMKQLAITLFLTFLLTNVYAQKLTTIKIKTPAPVKTKEIFQVLKENKSIKNGSYKKYRSKKLIESGYYKNNQRDSLWEIYSQKGQIIASGKYKADTLVGIWTYYSFSGSILQRFDHDHDSLIYFNIQEESKIGSAPKTFPDTAQDQFPIFIGGTAYMFTLIQNNIIYPFEAWKKLKTGKVLISFIVDSYGNTTEVVCKNPVGNGFDEEGIRLVKSFGKAWIPGVQKGRKVKVQYTLPLTFKMK